MKKPLVVVLTLLMVFISCLAQGAERARAFSIEGTVWLYTIIDSSNPELIGENHYHAFYKGNVYISGGLYILKHSAYVDLPQGSYFLIIRQTESLQPNKSVIGFVYNSGIGFAFDGDNIFLLNKINDNWRPPDAEQEPAYHPRFLLH
jgi:hypothetical protein